MITIQPLQPHQIEEARMVIYRTQYAVNDEGATLEEVVRRYRKDWPLRDLEDFQRVYFENRGAFLVTCDNGRVIGTGALRPLEGDTGEIKRIWLLPEYQGQGHGYRMMLALLAKARELGYTKMRLETHRRTNKRAWDFYLRMGFYEIPRYGDDPEDFGMEMVL